MNILIYFFSNEFGEGFTESCRNRLALRHDNTE